MIIYGVHIVTGLYYFALIGLFVYGLHRIWLIFCLYRSKRKRHFITGPLTAFDLNQRVTVQLPVYNERFVAARLLDCVAQFEWPSEMMEIQVLDDSTDDTRGIVDERIQYWSKKGLSIPQSKIKYSQKWYIC